MALQTKTYSVGSFDRYSGVSNGYILDLILTEEAIDATANTSHVSYKLQLRSGPSNRFDWEFTSTLSLNGIHVAESTAGKYLDYNSTWVLLEGQVTIAHNANGLLDMPFSAVVTPWNGGTQYTPPELTLSGKMSLTSIARASTIAASSAYIEETSTIVVSRKNSGYTHSIRYKFGGLTGYLADATGTHSDTEVKLSDTTILFPVPASFYAQIPNTPSGVCTLTCITYSGDTQIGEPQTATFAATASEIKCDPVVSGTAIDTDATSTALTGKNTTFISGITDVLCTVNATARNGASIKARYVNGKEITGTSLNIPDIDTASVVLRAVDSRGYAAEYIVPGLSIVDYTELSASANAWRLDPTDGTAMLEVYGNYYPGSFGASTNNLQIRYCIGSGDWVAVTPEISDGSYRMRQSLSGLDYRQRFTLTVQVEDSLQMIEKQVQLGKGVPIFDWGEEDFAFHVPVRFTASDGTVFTLDLVDGQLRAVT